MGGADHGDVPVGPQIVDLVIEAPGIGISTQKLHARGPMGLAQLTTAKFVVRGDGQTRG